MQHAAYFCSASYQVTLLISDAHDRPKSPFSEPELMPAASSSTSAIETVATGAARTNGHRRARATQQPSAAAGSSADEAETSRHTTRLPKGRVALLENTLAKENKVRDTLLREEHTLCLSLMKEDHEERLQKSAAEHSMEVEVKRAKKELVHLKLEQLKQAEK